MHIIALSSQGASCKFACDYKGFLWVLVSVNIFELSASASLWKLILAQRQLHSIRVLRFRVDWGEYLTESSHMDMFFFSSYIRLVFFLSEETLAIHFRPEDECFFLCVCGTQKESSTT